MSARDATGVDYSTASSSAAYTATQLPVSMYRTEGGAVGGEEDQAASSSTLEQESATAGKLKNKKRQPKYRATKRPPSERRFQCDHCESRFFTQKDVKRHLVVHTGVRNFPCPFCTQKFGRKDHLVRHAKKSHDQDTRSFKRRNGRVSPGASSSFHRKDRPTRKGSSRSRRKTGDTGRDHHFAQPSTSSASNATLTTTSITSPSTSYYLHDNGFNNSLNRAAAATSTHPHFSNSTIMLSSTSTSPLTPFPKMTLVDVHSSTSALTASITHPRNYHSSFTYESPTSAAASSNFNYNINGASTAVATSFNQFLPPPPDASAGGSQYASLQLPPPGNAYLSYDYKPPPGNSSLNYPGSSSSHHEAFNSGHLPGAALPGNGAGNLSFKTITAEGFNNTCIELEYSAAAAAAAGMASAFGGTAPAISSSSAPFGDSGQHVATRFHSPFN
ncbi:hypothetical protein TYRP_004306 [Tyrophagus putrescentiae]|nr:hypothetical protein TYRP_004306 [Tyrophagus putrescentiae]